MESRIWASIGTKIAIGDSDLERRSDHRARCAISAVVELG